MSAVRVYRTIWVPCSPQSLSVRGRDQNKELPVLGIFIPSLHLPSASARPRHGLWAEIHYQLWLSDYYTTVTEGWIDPSSCDTSETYSSLQLICRGVIFTRKWNNEIDNVNWKNLFNLTQTLLTFLLPVHLMKRIFFVILLWSRLCNRHMQLFFK